MYSTLLGTNISTEGYVNTYCWFFSKEEKQSVFKYLVWERNRVTKQIFWHSPKISFSELATWSNWKKQFPLHSGFMDSGAIWKKRGVVLGDPSLDFKSLLSNSGIFAAPALLRCRISICIHWLVVYSLKLQIAPNWIWKIRKNTPFPIVLSLPSLFSSVIDMYI